MSNIPYGRRFPAVCCRVFNSSASPLRVILGFEKSTVCGVKVFVSPVESYGHLGHDHGKRAPIRELRTGRTQFPIDTEGLHGKFNDHRYEHGFGPNHLNTVQLVSCLRNTLHYSDAVQSLFASDIEHFGRQTDAEWRVKNHRLSEGLRARVSVI